MDQSIISWGQKVIITIFIGIIAYILYSIKDIIFLLLIAGFLTIIINPLVNLGEKYKIPAWITLISVFIMIFLLGSIVIGTLIPIIVSYISESIGSITTWASSAKEVYVSKGIQGFGLNPYIERSILFLFGEDNINNTFDIIRQNAGNIQTFLTNQISSLTSGGITIVGQVGGVIASWLLVMICTFFMVLERKEIGEFTLALVPKNIELYLKNNYEKIQGVFTAWIKAMFILSVSIFLTTYIGLHIAEWIGAIWIEEMYIDKKFTLALISGIMEFIPYFGPLLALIPAFIIGLGISWKAALIIGCLYLLIQRIENDFLVPRVMSRALNLSPLLVFIIMLIGATLGGVLGIILAIPIAGLLRILFEEWKRKHGGVGVIKPVVKKLTNEKKSIKSK